jgi:galactitol-specific phosphotransferase system IIB component
MKKVAIEKGLSNVKNYLSNEGYNVKEFDNRKKGAKNFLNKFDAVVTTGEDKNIMGFEDTITNTTIINANGMTPENIKTELEKTFK